ncbi:MAG: hypothetical protein DRH30_12410 [Deltaproteobacteria bacterium]|nr:MAG: hypothetical protein DRH30_12410 [Deltaproteobacteria bacterium]
MLKTALAIFVFVGLSLLALGLVYLTRVEFMPYHSEAIQTAWSNLNSNYQGLILGGLKAFGGSALMAGFAIVFMAIASLRKSVRPFMVLLPTVATGSWSLLFYATYTVQTSTPGNPPLLLVGLVVAMSVLASTLLVLSQRTKSA